MSYHRAPSVYSSTSSSRSSSSSGASSSDMSSSRRSSRSGHSSTHYELSREYRRLDDPTRSLRLLRIFGGVDPIFPRPRSHSDSRHRVNVRDSEGRRYEEVKSTKYRKEYNTSSSQPRYSGHSTSTRHKRSGNSHRKSKAHVHYSDTSSESDSEPEAGILQNAANLMGLGRVFNSAPVEGEPMMPESMPGHHASTSGRQPMNMRQPTIPVPPQYPRTGQAAHANHMPMPHAPQVPTASRHQPVAGQSSTAAKKLGPKVSRREPFVIQTTESAKVNTVKSNKA